MFIHIKFFQKYGVQIIAAIIACLGMMSDGMQFAFASPAAPKLLANDSVIPMTKSDTEWVTMSYLAGCVIGAFLSSFIFEFISREWAIFASCVPIALAWFGMLLSSSTVPFFIARFIGGIGRTMIYVSVPLYLGEMASPEIRGFLGTFIYILMNIGGVTVYVLTPYVELSTTCTVGLIMAIAQLVLIYFLPQSPYYLLSVNKPDEAKKSLKLLRQRDDVESEFQDLVVAVKRQMEEKTSFWANFFKLFSTRVNCKATCILLFLRVAQMFAGISVMTMNIHTVFGSVSSGGISTNTAAIIYSLIMLTSAILTLGTMERFGRKTLMIFSCFVSALSMIAEGIFFYLKEDGYDVSNFFWVPLAGMVTFVYGYRVGLGTVPIVMLGELLSVSVKVQGVALSDLACMLSSFAGNALFYSTSRHFGLYAPFFIFGGCCVLATIISYLFVPETRGKTLEEIQFLLMNKNKKVENDASVDTKV